MFAVLAAALVVAAVAHLLVVVRADRPTRPPRSHRHELEQFSYVPRGI